MDEFQELRKKCIEIMGEADFNRLMNQFNQSSDKEKMKIEEFLNDLITKEMEGKKEDENIALDETQKLTKAEVEKVLQQAKEKSKDILE